MRHLYQHIFSIDYPSLAFVGLPWSVIPFPLFYMQALVISKAFSCSSTLPSASSMRHWLSKHESTHRTANHEIDTHMYHYLGGKLQFEYMRELLHTYFEAGDSSDKSADAAHSKSVMLR